MKEYDVLKELVENWLKEHSLDQDVLLLSVNSSERHDRYDMYYPNRYVEFVATVIKVMQEWGSENGDSEINNGIDMWNYCMKEKDFGMIINLYKKTSNGNYVKIY